MLQLLKVRRHTHKMHMNGILILNTIWSTNEKSGSQYRLNKLIWFTY
jgi:hypothetical protein